MSKACKKLLRDKQNTFPQADQIEEEDLVPTFGGSSNRPANLFALASDLLSSSESEISPDDDSQEDEASARPKNKKKKKKPQNKASENGSDSENKDDNAAEGSKRRWKKRLAVKKDEEDSADEVERSLREVNLLLGEPSNVSADSESSCPNLYLVETRLLDPFTEMNKFKKKPPRPRNSPIPYTHLVTPDKEWAPYAIPVGLSMRFEKNDAGEFLFEYNHNQVYEQVQHTFKRVMSSIPSRVIEFLQMYPAHVETLLQCAIISRRSRDTIMEMELVTRALFALEVCAHASFGLGKNDRKLLYSQPTNRSMHIALLQQSLLASHRGAPRAALELCRLGLSLDGSDPLGLLLLLDSLSLAAGQFKWFVQFCYYQINMPSLPNLAYSLSLAQFKLTGDSLEAKTLLHRAVTRFPWVLIPLLEDERRFQIDPDIKNHLYFSYESLPQAAERLLQLYIKRTGHLWRTPEVQQWAQSCALGMLSTLDGTPPPDARPSIFFRCVMRHLILSRDAQALFYQDWSTDDLLAATHDPYPESLPSPELPTARQSIIKSFVYSLSPYFRNDDPGDVY